MAARAHFNLNSSLRMRSLKQWGQTTSSEANNVSNAVVWLTRLQSPAERTLMKELLYRSGNLAIRSRDSLTNRFLWRWLQESSKDLSGSSMAFQEARE
jgi:hypothetical protein